MIRIAILAAVAAFAAAPAFAGSVHVSTTGKSAEQVKAEVTSIARRLCTREIAGASFPIDEMNHCVKHTVAAAFAQAKDPAIRLATR